MIDVQKFVSAPELTEKTTRPHLAYLDGIRGLMALFVVFHHTWLGLLGGNARPGLIGWLTNWLLYGHLAVDVFIVLSGFCLVLPIAKSGYIKGGGKDFCFRRAHRILPPFYLALLLSLLLNFLMHKIGNHPLVSLKAVLANIFLLQDWLPGFNILDGPLWSVAVEWKIYFLFPLFIWIWKRFSMTWALFFAAVLGYSATLVFHLLHPASSMGHTCPWYVFLFVMGMSAGGTAINNSAVVSRFKPRLIIFAPLLPLIYLLAKYPVTASGEETLYVPHFFLTDPVVGLFTAAVLLLLYRCQKNSKKFWLLTLTSWPPLVLTGTFAYSLYLVHLPLLWIIVGGLHRLPIVRSSFALTALIEFFIVIPLIVCLAYVFYLMCERPFLNKNKAYSSLTTMSEGDTKP